MRVAVVIERIEHWRGGAETSTQQFIHHLAARGCEVHLMTASRIPSSPDMAVHTLPVPRPTRRAQTVQFLRRAEAEVGHKRFDVIHSMAPIINCDVYQPRGGTAAESVERNLALVRSRLLRRGKRFANRFNTKQQSLLRQESRLFRRRRRPLIAALSQYVVDQLRHHYHVDDSRIRLVFNGVDVPEVSEEQRQGNRRNLREQFGLKPQDLVLLMVAHNFKLKGVARGIEAVERLKRSGGPTVKALIVGRDNPLRCRHLAERLAIADQIIFVGPTERVLAFYHAADILVHPTYYDPCSRVVLEALASGLPAITTRHNGAAEVIKDGKHGYVIDSADAVDQLADRICRLADRDHRRACGEQGRRLRDRLSMARHTDEMLVVYQEILQGREG
jgi:UDP-glucose:(heptosyl)LPS alpha-1,3-glucosyltransferase